MGKVANADGDADIEAEISRELKGLRSSKHRSLFQPVRVDVQCGKYERDASRASLSDVDCGPVLFFRTRAPIEPVSFVHKICSDALELANSKKHRWVRRLTPMSRMGKATEKGLDAVSKAVLGPAFHDEGSSPKKVSLTVVLFPRCHS